MLSPDFVWQGIGMAGAALTTFAYIPQIAKVWRYRSAKALSLPTLVQLTVGVTLWMVYGIYLHSFIVFGANLITLLSLILLIGLCLAYRKR